MGSTIGEIIGIKNMGVNSVYELGLLKWSERTWEMGSSEVIHFDESRQL
jgi:hypothetical protein